MQNETIPSMVLAIDTVPPEISPSLAPEVIVSSDTNLEEDVLPQKEQMEDLSSQNTEKKLRLEQDLMKIKLQLDYVMNITDSLLIKHKRDLKDNKKEAVKFTTDCFDDMSEDNGFITWLANGTGYKPNWLKQVLKENKPHKQNRNFMAANFQGTFDIWLDNYINSNESAYNMKIITKRSFLKKFWNIINSNVTQKRVQLKKGSKVIFAAPRMVYVKSVCKLYSSFNQKHANVSLSFSFRYMPYYCASLTEKEKLSCLCINLPQSRPPHSVD